jgi:CTP synthase (UTP-ammonia lyase)
MGWMYSDCCNTTNPDGGTLGGMSSIAIGVLIDLPESQPYYVATLAALEHAAHAQSLDVDVHVLRTDQIGDGRGLPHAALVIGPGSPYREPEAVYEAIRSARERSTPLVGT